MFYLYHAIPKHMEGHILYPLNALKEIFPDVYAQEMAKYEGREQVMQQRIPVLNCLWNDVLHMTAIPPTEMKKARAETGNPDFTKTYYQIDPTMLEPEKSIVFLYAGVHGGTMHPENFAPYHPDDVAKYAVIPSSVKAYYTEMLAQGKHPLLYHKIPHILYKGTLDITKLPIVSV